MSSLVLGLDGGGSSTVAHVVSHLGKTIGSAEVGPSNIKAIGEEAGLLAIGNAMRLAMSQAGVDRVQTACLGLAGLDHEDDRRRVERWCERQNIADRLILVNDAELVLAAGTPHGWGVALISGTGSIGVGRNSLGQTARAGGWGHLFGDEGSGYSTATAALRLVARRFDGRHGLSWREDPLSLALCHATDVTDPSGLVSRIYSPEFDRARIAKLAAVVVRTSQDDARSGRDLLEPAGRALAQIALAVVRRLNLTPEALPIALSGGFLLSAPVVEHTLIETLQAAGYTPLTARVEEPVVGAVQIATMNF